MPTNNGNGPSKRRKNNFLIIRDEPDGNLGKRLKKAAKAAKTTVTDLVRGSLLDTLSKIENAEPHKETTLNKARKAVNRVLDQLEQQEASSE